MVQQTRISIQVLYAMQLCSALPATYPAMSLLGACHRDVGLRKLRVVPAKPLCWKACTPVLLPMAAGAT